MDIALCSGMACPLKDACHRHTANPDAARQSYFTEPPFQLLYESGDTKEGFLCSYYRPNTEEKNGNNTV